MSYRELESLVSRMLRERPHGPVSESEIPEGLDPAGRAYLEGAVRYSWRRPGQAAQFLADALHLDPQSPLARAMCATLFLDGADRVAFLRTLADACPDLARPKIELGYALRSERSPQEAANCFQAALSIEADDLDAWYGLGLSLLAAGDRQGASEAAEKMVELTPQTALWAGNAALLLWRARHRRRAVQVARNAARIHRSWRLRLAGWALPLMGLPLQVQIAIVVVIGIATVAGIVAALVGSFSLLALSPVLVALGYVCLVLYVLGWPHSSTDRKLLDQERARLQDQVRARLYSGVA